jgi:LPS-assembly lipoprotein
MQLMPPKLAVLALFALALSLSACGYHLRGVTALNPVYAKVFVQGMSESDPVYQQLQYLFQNTHSQLVRDPHQATATLVIDKNEVTQRVAVVTPQASVQQYELYQRIKYHIELPDGRTTQPQTLGRALNYNYDPVGVLASTGNQQQISQELAQSIAQLLFYRLSAPISAAKPKESAQATSDAVQP